MTDHLPREARVLERIQESKDIFTLRLAFTDEAPEREFEFQPGQFNMVSLYGVGEVPISIVSDPVDNHFFDHTIRRIGRVTEGMDRLQPGDRLGIRGPFGRGWPMQEAEGKDLLLVTGGLGCAPLVSVIRYVLRRRERFGHVTILQGVRHSNDLIWREQYQAWAEVPGVDVHLAADVGAGDWPWHTGPVVELFERLQFDPERTLAMLCGPELMMLATVAQLRERNLADQRIWVSLERNMQCANGLCGHCQLGPWFVCKDGPVFPYAEIADLFGVKGF